MHHGHGLCGLGPLMIRLGLGSVFIAHGSQKVLGLFGGSGLQATVQGFMEMGNPEWVGYAVALGELLGGLGVFFGCLTRLAGLGLAAIMGGAIYFVHLPHGFFLNHFMEPDKGHGIEFALALCAMGLSLLFTGGGILSIDRLLFGKRSVPGPSEAPPTS